LHFRGIRMAGAKNKGLDDSQTDVKRRRAP
jgi:hypothetical protein